MADSIKLKRGTKAKLPKLDYGEPAFISDEEELYIGTEGGNIKLTNRSEVEELKTKNNEISSQLELIETKKTSNYLYNIGSLKQINSNTNLNIVCLGDSIGAGTGASDNFGFMQQFYKTIAFYNKYVSIINFIDSGSKTDSTEWQNMMTGIGKGLLHSNNLALSLNVFKFSWFAPQKEHKIKVIYSTRIDGGTFDVGYTDPNGSNKVIVTSISCNGPTKDAIFSDEITIPGGKMAMIYANVGQKAYINGAKLIDLSATCNIDNFSIGGMKATEYSNDDLLTTLTFEPKNVLIWELFANDWQIDLQLYKDKAEYIISEAKNRNMDVIIPIACGADFTTTNNQKWEERKACQYYLADKYDCAIIDFDNLFNGFKNAKANGLIADTIHPSAKGHKLMADVMCEAILRVRNITSESYSIFQDYRSPFSGEKTFKDKRVFEDDVLFKKIPKIQMGSDVTSNQTMAYVGGWWDTAQLPSSSFSGDTQSIGDAIYTYSNSSWKQIASYAIEADYNNISPMSANLGKLMMKNSTGKETVLFTCVKKADGGYKFVKLNTTDI